MMAVATSYIEGIGLWAGRLPGWEAAGAILRGEVAAPEQPAKRPSVELLPPNERRRAPDTVAISLEVASQACRHAGRDPASLPSVFVSTHGDLAITDYMCETLAATPELISPTKFHNSVHNAAAGYWAIATGCRQPYTAISAHRHSFGSGLLEALLQAQSDQTAVLLVAYDIAATGPLAETVPSSGLFGVALVLSPAAGPNARFALRWQLSRLEASQQSQASTENASLVAGNAMAAALPLFEAIARSSGNINCAVGPNTCLQLDVAMINQQLAKRTA